MKIRAPFGHLRLLPAVIVLAATLLAIKGVNLVQVARAEVAAGQETQGNAAIPQSGQAATDTGDEPAPGEDLAVDDSSTSAAEVDVLTSLSKRRAELDAREQALNMRANLLAAAEQRVDAKIADLKSLQSQIQTLLGHRDDAEQKQLTALVKVYSAMKPRDAARIFNTLDPAVLLEVAGAMKPDSLAAIMAAMNPEQAQGLTVKLADRLKLPKTPDVSSTAQLAAAAPASVSAPGSTSQNGTSPVAAAVQASPPAASGAPAPAGSTAAPAASGG